MKVHRNDVLVCWVSKLDPSFTLEGVRERLQSRVLAARARQLWIEEFNGETPEAWLIRAKGVRGMTWMHDRMVAEAIVAYTT